ncbi:hypothetical protein M2103_001376 [Ereboglobus sp. PH5-5]|uniref:Knr4/Smi1-like domain-containing protein n=1 Tax=Ereboglobus luteus TaxID=1796921 RepID=A0A2U8E695_9BACT|nr:MULTISPECIES: SMI1/KNR4 family protein [Ereboglobus]AWI10377.1 hypothetical protein CKA38_14930 [Ereboglobus luteus]MDF9833154.1 hypothetical protein [Ereboglobus sp. PH5-5]
MTPDQKHCIKEAHLALPEGFGAKPASESALCAFEKKFGPIPADYRWYLAECGGGVVRSETLDDIKELTKSHRKFEREAAMDGGWKKRDGFLIGWDGSGNPISMDTATGQIMVEDHDFGGVHVLAASFADFCLGTK